MMASTLEGDPKLQGKTNKKNTRLRYIKMQIIEDQSYASFEKATKDHFSPSAELHTDGLKPYSKLKSYVKKHVAKKIPPKEAEKLLPWVYTTIANLKRGLLGRHHNVRDDYLQNYLNEFCYKVNRRYFEDQLFDRMMIAAVEQPWYGLKSDT